MVRSSLESNNQPDLKSLRQHEITHLGDGKGIFRRSNEKSSQNKSELRTPRKLPSIKYQKQSPSYPIDQKQSRNAKSSLDPLQG